MRVRTIEALLRGWPADAVAGVLVVGDGSEEGDMWRQAAIGGWEDGRVGRRTWCLLLRVRWFE